ncbi:MAG: MarR family winged helix-turn-helix transcriptional regulator [Huintestinicola sp.]|uniref:MarR family winged helix-turn-helix transcriptional regulator n=1 Tax=Huintestinicola sp. TaxID=2981661 RepID=UPI003F0442DB
MDENNSVLVAKLFEQLKELYFSRSPLGFEEFLRGEMKVLSYICLEGGELLPGQLASSLEMTGGRIAGILRSLEKKGYITRRTDELDRRRVLVSITESGSRYIVSRSEALETRLDMLVTAMGRDNTIKLIDSLSLFVRTSESVFENDGGTCPDE